MALLMTLHPGEDVYVGDTKFVVEKILTDKHVQVRRGDGRLFDIVHDRSVEAATDVFLAVGDRGQLNMCRLMIDAPRSMLILRGSKKRGEKA